ncbi:MAG: flavin reductase family protein [Coriobacteriales bacterium]|nr:flavin reductase family protein [Coriobacteriales bacterium]
MDSKNQNIKILEGRQIASALAPTSVAILSAKNSLQDAKHKHCVATIAWFMPISHEPSMIAFALRGQGETAKAISSSKVFALNLLSPDYLDANLVCGSPSDDRLNEAQLDITDAQKINTCVIEQAHSVFECSLVEQKTYGDHDLFVANVEYAFIRNNKDNTNILIKDRNTYGTFIPLTK